MRIVAARARLFVESGNRLNVVIKDVGRHGKKFINCSLDSSAKIRNEDFNFYAFLFS